MSFENSEVYRIIVDAVHQKSPEKPTPFGQQQLAGHFHLLEDGQIYGILGINGINVFGGNYIQRLRLAMVVFNHGQLETEPREATFFYSSTDTKWEWYNPSTASPLSSLPELKNAHITPLTGEAAQVTRMQDSDISLWKIVEESKARFNLHF